MSEEAPAPEPILPAEPEQKPEPPKTRLDLWIRQQPGETEEEYLLRLQVRAAYARECLAKKYARNVNKYAMREMLESIAHFVYLRILKMKGKKRITWTQADEKHMLEMVKEFCNVSRRIDDHEESKKMRRRLPRANAAIKDSDEQEDDAPAQTAFAPGRAIQPANGVATASAPTAANP